MPPSKDEVVKAVLSNALNARRLVAQFTAAVGDPIDADAEFDEIDSGGFVSFKDMRAIYEVYDEQ